MSAISAAAAMRIEVVRQPLASVRKQHLMDERDRRRRSLDVEEHRAETALGQPNRHMPAPERAAGRYDGPKQTG